jgi:hypothetical protein
MAMETRQLQAGQDLDDLEIPLAPPGPARQRPPRPPDRGPRASTNKPPRRT